MTEKNLLLVNLQFEIFLKSRFYCTYNISIDPYLLKSFSKSFELKSSSELNITNHSMAKDNLNKRVWLVTNTTAASKCIPRRPRISINFILTKKIFWKFFFKKQLLFSFLCIVKQKNNFGAIRNFLKNYIFLEFTK